MIALTIKIPAYDEPAPVCAEYDFEKDTWEAWVAESVIRAGGKTLDAAVRALACELQLRHHEGRPVARSVASLSTSPGTPPEVLIEKLKVLKAGLEGLVQANLKWLESHPEAPPLLKSGVSYKPNTFLGTWAIVPIMLKYGCGDAEDLSCWYAAELRRKGVSAHVEIKREGQALMCSVVYLDEGGIRNEVDVTSLLIGEARR